MKPGTTKTKWKAIACALALCGSVQARAQTLPSEPIVFAEGRVTFGGDVSASFAPKDTGYFNYTDYEHSALRLLRIDFTGSLKAGDHLAVLGEVRSKTSGARGPTHYSFGSGRGRRGSSTFRSAECRPPSAPSRGARMRPTIRSSATRLPIST